MKLAVARMHGAVADTILAWQAMTDNMNELLQ